MFTSICWNQNLNLSFRSFIWRAERERTTRHNGWSSGILQVWLKFNSSFFVKLFEPIFFCWFCKCKILKNGQQVRTPRIWRVQCGRGGGGGPVVFPSILLVTCLSRGVFQTQVLFLRSVVISQTRWLVSRVRLPPTGGTALFILYTVVPSVQWWF